MNVLGKRISLLLVATVLALVALIPAIHGRKAYAAQITSRSLTLVAGASDGGSKPGGSVNHLFSFTVPTSASIGSIQFLYCTTASGTCTTPTGLVTTSATIGSQNGASFTSLVNTTNGAPYLTRTAATISASTALSYQLNTITNPTTANQTFYVRISTFTSTNATTGSTDTGTVTASTATQIVLTGIMPESLIFCTGQTVSTTSSIPDCTTATAGAINFNQLFSPTDTATATSQMAASTNAGSGYSITVNGPTLTSGGNTITAMGSQAAGVRGTSQFGLNLMANTSTTASSFPGTSASVAPTTNGTTYKGQPTSTYGTGDQFKFTSGDSVANSANGGAGPTNAQIYTASYIVNVTGAQPAGTYVSTLTYICTATF